MEEPEKRKKVKIYHNRKYNIRISNITKVFLASFILFVILHLILSSFSSLELWIFYIIILCITEVSGLIILLLKLD